MDAHVQQGDEVARLYGRKNLTVGNAVAQRRAAADDIVHMELAHVVHAPAYEAHFLPRDAPRPEGMEFRPNAALTKAECAVMLQNMLDLPQPDTQPVFSVEEGECIASWAVPSASALQSAGLELTPLADGTLTRRECAELLYQLSTLCQQDVLDHFRWDS